MRLLIANGYVIDPTQGIHTGKSVFIEDGRVVGLLSHSDDVPEGCEVIDAIGLIVAPGLVDMHAHLREPGHEYKETIASGAAAAVAGGFATVCAMPNTDPINDSAAVTRFIIEQAENAQMANVLPIGARVHLAHVSTIGAIEAVRRAKEKGLAVTCEVAPHHWTLTDEAVADYDTNTKMSPPLRTADHIGAILKGLRDGTIDAIATDHAPHHADEKALEYDQAPFGITGLETAVGLAFEHLVNKGTISLERLVELCSVNPARIFNLTDRGTLR